MTFKWTRCYKVLWHLQHSRRLQRNVEPWMTFCIVLYFAYQIPQMIFKVHDLKFLTEILFLTLCMITPKISISAKSIKFFLCMKQFCLLLLSIPYFISLAMVTSIISHIFTNIFQMKHISAVKFLMSHGKNTSFLSISKSHKSLKKKKKKKKKALKNKNRSYRLLFSFEYSRKSVLKFSLAHLIIVFSLFFPPSTSPEIFPWSILYF